MCKQSAQLLTKIKSCRTIKQVEQVHAQTITTGLLSLLPSSSSILLTNILHYFTSLLTPSQNPISLNYAIALFYQIKNPTTFCYNTIIRAHTLLSFPQNALSFFTQMRSFSIPPDSHTFPFVLKACTQLRSVFLAKSVHCQSFKFGFVADVFVCNNLIVVYSVTGHVWDAYKVFHEACYKDVVSGNSMIDGFVKSDEIANARKVFDEMHVKDAMSWGTLIAGYVQKKELKEGIDLFDCMVALAFRPDNVALVSVLSACAQLGELEKGKAIHEYIERNGIRIDAFLSTGLVDLYAKCGCIEIAREIFNSCSDKNLFTWNAMLVGFAVHGYGELLLDHLCQMVEAGIKPDGVTFLGVLLGCSHAGLIDEARRLFGEMESVYGVPKELKHYGCMADLLGRAGLIEEACEMINAMPVGGDVFVWGGLLGGCRVHGNVEIAEKAAEHVMEISPQDGGVYKVLASVYANAGQWDDLAKIRRLRDVRMVKKKAGCSLIQVDEVTHEFVAGDDLHPQTNEIYSVLESLGQH